jgi:molecular chaperone GrpE
VPDDNALDPDSPQDGATAPAEKPASLGAALAMPPESDAGEANAQRARLAEARLAEVMAAYRQLKTDHEGYKDRTARNLERRFDQRHERLLQRFIEILDNFDRALEAAEQSYAGAPLIEGLILVRTQLLQTLQQEGLERVPVLGLAFDPHVAEAVSVQPVTDPEHHQIVMKELQRGYRVNGKLVRPSRVVVGQLEADAGATAPSTTAQAAEAVPAGDDSEAFLPVDVSGADLATQAEGLAANAGQTPAASTAPVFQPLDEDETMGAAGGGTAHAGATSGSSQAAPPHEGEPTLEEIIARAEAQHALFPEAFDEEQDGDKEKDAWADGKEWEPEAE